MFIQATVSSITDQPDLSLILGFEPYMSRSLAISKNSFDLYDNFIANIKGVFPYESVQLSTLILFSCFNIYRISLRFWIFLLYISSTIFITKS